MASDLIKTVGHTRIIADYGYKQQLLVDKRNTITFRGKSIMAALLAGQSNLSVTGIALGNGGHALHWTAPSLVNADPDDELTTQSATPHLGGGIFGYDSTTGQTVPGATYEAVENGNIPWDGTGAITDNRTGVTDPNTTLFSETGRIAIDGSGGISYPSATSVQFKATLPQNKLNDTNLWGYANRPANWISEAGLVVGDLLSATGDGQRYSTDGNFPSAANFEALTNKDDDHDSPNVDITAMNAGLNAADTSWYLLARNTFPVITKTSEFSLVFFWTISF